MKTNPYSEQVFVLLEQFDFKALPEPDRLFVLSEMSEEEYSEMRNTIKDTEIFFLNSNEPDLNEKLFSSIIQTNYKPNILIKILNQPVKLYQFAACIALIIVLFTLKQYSDLPDKTSAIPPKDTIFIQKTDTVYSKLADSVLILKEKIHYISRERAKNSQVNLLSVTACVSDSEKIISHPFTARIEDFIFTKDVLSESILRD
jgi:hypothetical protein